MEMLDLIDENGYLTGQQKDRKEVHKQGLLHHASGVVILSNSSGGGRCKLLSQQRSLKKEKNAGLWDMSASGHVTAGESPLNSLIREVKEEIGIDLDRSEFHLLGRFWRHEKYRDDFVENELDYIFVVNKFIPINKIVIQKDEVENVSWIEIDKFKNLLKEGKAVKRECVWDELFTYIEEHFDKL